MANIIKYPITVAEADDPEPVVDIEEIASRQADLLERWVIFGKEVKRRLGPIPIDIALELCDLLKDSSE